jgi:hypothetical protein
MRIATVCYQMQMVHIISICKMPSSFVNKENINNIFPYNSYSIYYSTAQTEIDKDSCLLDCSALLSGRSLPTFDLTHCPNDGGSNNL